MTIAKGRIVERHAKGRIVERHATFDALACRPNFQLISKQRLADESVVEEKVGRIWAPRVKSEILEMAPNQPHIGGRQEPVCSGLKVGSRDSDR
jgi:hypothetical protein